MMMTTVFWDVVPWDLIEVDRRFTGAYCLNYQDDNRPDDGGSKQLRNVGESLQDYKAHQKYHT
jgi:hypothetical protein